MAKPHSTTEAKPGEAGKALPAVEAAPKTEQDRVVRVVAKRMGFYGNARRKPGAVFNITLSPGEKMPSWVVEDSGESAAATTSATTVEASVDESADVL